MTKKFAPPPGLPTREQILAFISESDKPAGKREIAREFGLKGAEKIALKALLKDMADEGLIDSAPGRAFHKMGGIPKVTVLRVVSVDDDQVLAVPDVWEADGIPIPRLRVMEKGRRGAMGVGDRFLGRTEERGQGHIAHVMKKLEGNAEQLMGVLDQDQDGKYWLRSIDKKARFDTKVSDIASAQPGQLVLTEMTGRPPRQTAKVIEILGDPFEARSFSLIAIHKHNIPHVFPDAVLAEAQRVSALPLQSEGREDLRHLPILAIDPRDARDHDDAIWAAPDPDVEGGYRAVVVIADVSYYVRPGSDLDREAKKRGNSVYFPDRVVPMLPHELSSDMCSLKAGQDRAALACHLTIDPKGKVTGWRFTRAVVRLAANIAYEDAQAAMDGTLSHDLKESALEPLWACWKLLAAARDAREPLNLDLPERRVELDEQGKIARISVRERLDAHRLVEDFMIAANVAAAKALEAKKSPVMYRVHEPPSREKLVGLKDYLDTFDIPFALGQVITPGLFNRILAKIDDETILPQIMEQVLRSQTQAYYTPVNAGHFGLSLGSYAHFTSPIRRYADLIVHRALVGAYGLDPDAEQTALTKAMGDDLDKMAQTISRAERRAMEAERETIDRYVAAYLSGQIGQIVQCRITGVQSFGFFATVMDLGGDGLVPVSTLGREFFHYDEASQTLTGEHSRTQFSPGQRIELRLAEANPVSGALRFELPDMDPGAARVDRGPRREDAGGRKKPMSTMRRGRPANIRHQGRKKK